jgi:hypothetical protein
MPEELTPKLAESETEPFLTWLFSDLSLKTEPLKLLETAAVARYLMLLAIHGVPTEIAERGPDAILSYKHSPKSEKMLRGRQAVERTAKILWADLLDRAEFKPSTKDEALKFLGKYASARHDPWFECAVNFLKNCEELDLESMPPRSATPFVAKTAAQNRGNPYLDDDLSERIAAADSALERAGVEDRQTVIAQALQDSPLTREQGPKDQIWGGVEVRARARTYRRQKHPMTREQVSNKWIGKYRSDIATEEMLRAGNRETENTSEHESAIGPDRPRPSST